MFLLKSMAHGIIIKLMSKEIQVVLNEDTCCKIL